MTWQVPTLVAMKTVAYIDDLYLSGDERLKYLSPSTALLWNPRSHPSFQGRTQEQIANGKHLFHKQSELVGALYRAGVPLLAGTDTPLPYVFPGFSLHEELALLVQAGLTPMAALQAATRNPAQCLHLLDSSGTIEPGKMADLVLLEANPLADIRNTQRIAAVIVRGRYFSQSQLQGMLLDAEVAAKKQ